MPRTQPAWHFLCECNFSVNMCEHVWTCVCNPSVNMALRIDEVGPGQLTSSLVDDVFFILRKCGMRALASSSAQVGVRSRMHIP